MSNKLEKSHKYFKEVAVIIEQARHRVEVAVNNELVTLYWNIGKVIKTQILDNEKPEYGQSIIEKLSVELASEYGQGYSTRNLFNMIRFFEVFSDIQSLYALRAKLTWTHIRKLIYIDDSLKREFYLTMTINEHWSSRTMIERINSQLYERTTISRKPEQTIINDLVSLQKKNEISADLVLRDPYVLDFLDLKDTFSEKDLENAIISELQRFMLEIGHDFTFVGRQVRIEINDKDFYIDLLFYHRKLRRLVAIELKLGEFKPEYKGQVELYLKWLEKHETNYGENPPIGIILCSEKDSVIVELLELDKSGIHVAQYITKTLKEKLPKAINRAKNTLEQRKTKSAIKTQEEIIPIRRE